MNLLPISSCRVPICRTRKTRCNQLPISNCRLPIWRTRKTRCIQLPISNCRLPICRTRKTRCTNCQFPIADCQFAERERQDVTIGDRQLEIGNPRTEVTMTMQLDWLRGCATALVTPFAGDGSVDEKRLRDLIEYQIAGNVRLLVPCGTTGESVTMTEEENQLVIRTTVELARGRAKVIAGTGSNSTAVTIQRSKAARVLGVDGVLTVAPYYNKPTQDGLYAHFRAIAEAVEGLPVVIYNVPGRTSSNIAAETTLRLARDVENIVAVKEASGNLSQIMEILRSRPAGRSEERR